VSKNNKYLSCRRKIALLGGLVLAKSGRLGAEDNILRILIGLSSTIVTLLACKAIECGEKNAK